MNLGGNLQQNAQANGGNEENLQTEDSSSPKTSLVTVFVSGKNPGEFSKVVSTITLTGDQEDKRRFKRSDEELLKSMLVPTKVQPVLRTAEPIQAFKFFDEDNFSANVIL